MQHRGWIQAWSRDSEPTSRGVKPPLQTTRGVMTQCHRVPGCALLCSRSISSSTSFTVSNVRHKRNNEIQVLSVETAPGLKIDQTQWKDQVWCSNAVLAGDWGSCATDSGQLLDNLINQGTQFSHLSCAAGTALDKSHWIARMAQRRVPRGRRCPPDKWSVSILISRAAAFPALTVPATQIWRRREISADFPA